jgi:hypothetical protein
MKIYFNPYKKFTGIFIPDWLLQSDCCSLNAKLVYALLCKYAGEDGSCYPKQSTLAKKMKTSSRSIVNYINELVDCRLIERKRTLQNNTYLFLVHPDMNLVSADSAHTYVNGASLTKVKTASLTYKESHNKENHNNIAFEDFWNAYSHKVGSKKKAEYYWNALKDKERDYIMNHLSAYVSKFNDKKFQPYPTTFLNQRYFEAEDFQTTKKTMAEFI